MRTQLFAAFLVVTACGDDGTHHLADAPLLPIDAAIDAMPKVQLSTTIAGTGAGTVTSSPSGITCSNGTCTGDFDPDTVVTLTAVANTGSVFVSWGGACSGTTPTCEVTLAQAASVTATFDIARYAVTVTKAGAGGGTITGSGINCGGTCTVMVDHGTMITLAQAPANLSVFAGWGGACSGTAACMVTVTGPTAISANFALDNLTLFVSKGGNGMGTVTATGIACGADCSESYTAGQMVTLTAAAGVGSTFTGWSGGGCAGTGTCVVTMNAAITVTATFTLMQFQLLVGKGGNGSGNVTSNPAGIACGIDCMENYDYNTMVVLTAAPSTGSTFTGWTGACSGNGLCMTTMTAARTVTANFTLMTFALTTSVTGSGSISSNPAGIACPVDCSQNYDYNTMVTLTPTPATGWSFTGWGGDCSGAGGCLVTMTAARNVTATFTIMTFPMLVTINGAGTGSVSSAPAGIACPADCSETYDYNTSVTLTAAPGIGSVFAGWSGGVCSGMGTCVTTMTAARNITATFNIATFQLDVTPAGTGGGTVTSAPAGINCPSASCSATYNYNTTVVLTAMADALSDFTGWNGSGCNGTGTCTVTMTAAHAVTATFTKKTFTVTITKSGDGFGVVSGNGLNCGANCMVTLPINTVISLTSTPASLDSNASSFTAWSGGGCSGNGACTFMLAGNTTVNAAFKLKPNLMFTTKATFNGNLGGLAGADAKCQAAAVGANLKGNYKAYLGATATNAPSRFAGASGWTRVDGAIMVQAIGAFGTTNLTNAPNIDELGGTITAAANEVRVWTATAADSTYFGQNCNAAGNAPDWTDTASRTEAGNCTQLNFAVLTGGSVLGCALPLHLYCFGTDRAATVP